MSLVVRYFVQPVLCTVGLHAAPPPRAPHGPIVATCPGCGKTIYYYGLSAHGLGGPSNLLLPSFPRVIPALPPPR